MVYYFIVPNNTNWRDVNNPIFFGGIWGLLSLSLVYLSFMFVSRTIDSVFNNNQKYSGKVGTITTDIVIQAVFGFLVMIALFASAWSTYVYSIYANYKPIPSLVSPPVSLPQDIYAIVQTSTALLYMISMYIYRWYVVTKTRAGHSEINETKMNHNGSIDVGEKNVMAEPIVVMNKDMDKETSDFSYIFRYSVPMFCTISFVLFPGVYAFSSSYGFDLPQTWIVLVTAILLTLSFAKLYYVHVAADSECQLFSNNHIITHSFYDSLHSHAICGHIVNQNLPLYLILSYIMYLVPCEILIYGDQMKPTASFYIKQFLPFFMMLMSQNKGTFFPFHIAMTVYFLSWVYLVESIYPPQNSALHGEAYVFANLTDPNFFTTGPEYGTISTYGSTLLWFSILSFIGACVCVFTSNMIYEVPMTTMKYMRRTFSRVPVASQ